LKVKSKFSFILFTAETSPDFNFLSKSMADFPILVLMLPFSSLTSSATCLLSHDFKAAVLLQILRLCQRSPEQNAPCPYALPAHPALLSYSAKHHPRSQ